MLVDQKASVGSSNYCGTKNNLQTRDICHVFVHAQIKVSTTTLRNQRRNTLLVNAHIFGEYKPQINQYKFEKLTQMRDIVRANCILTVQDGTVIVS